MQYSLQRQNTRKFETNIPKKEIVWIGLPIPLQ
jgi:hypothetical protein